MGWIYRGLRSLLFLVPPERAHRLGLGVARAGGGALGRAAAGRIPAGPAVMVAGLRFPNPLGLAAGYDKNGVALPFWRAIGFGHVEFGTVTPRPQPGNPGPRLWRFPRVGALGNRLGFPNDGARAVAERLKATRRPGDVVGINLGKNRDTPLENAADDYVAALEATRDVADYWTVNVSSPNTPGLRELQRKGALSALLSRVKEASGDRPLFVKLSPDMDDAQLAEACDAVRDAGADGVVATNTTLHRPEGLRFEGGLSGRPLAERARAVLAALRVRLGPGFPIVSVGGVDSGAEARARLEAGADLVQLYTALVFEGPGLPARILRELADHAGRS